MFVYLFTTLFVHFVGVFILSDVHHGQPDPMDMGCDTGFDAGERTGRKATAQAPEKETGMMSILELLRKTAPAT